jgi:antitoxin ParD1/3/4
MTTMNISLPQEMREFVEEQLRAGGYSTASEYIRELIRNAQKEKARARLEALLLEGLDSGEPIEITPEYWDQLRAEARQRWDARKKKIK